MKETVHLSLDVGLVERIDQLAKEIPELGTRQNVLRALTLEGLERHEKDPKKFEALVLEEHEKDKAQRKEARAKTTAPQPKRGSERKEAKTMRTRKPRRR